MTQDPVVRTLAAPMLTTEVGVSGASRRTPALNSKQAIKQAGGRAGLAGRRAGMKASNKQHTSKRPTKQTNKQTNSWAPADSHAVRLPVDGRAHLLDGVGELDIALILAS